MRVLSKLLPKEPGCPHAWYLGVAVVLILSSCSPPKAPQAECTATTKVAAAQPGALVPIVGIPADATDVSASFGSRDLLLGREKDSGWTILAPFFSSEDLFASGVVMVHLEVDGVACGTVSFSVEGLPDSATNGVRGGFERLVRQTESSVDSLLAEIGMGREDLIKSAEVGTPQYPLLYLADFLVRGEANPNSLRRMLTDGEFRLENVVTELDMDTIDALVFFADAGAQLEAVPIGLSLDHADLPPPNIYLRARTPEGLIKLIERQYQAENELLPIADGLLQVGTAVSLAVPPPWNAVAAAVLTAGSAAKWALVGFDVHDLPNGVELHFEVSEPTLAEDEVGYWHNLTVTPKNMGGMDVKGSLIDIALQGVGILGFSGRYANVATDKVATLVTTVLGAANSAVERVTTQPFKWDDVDIPAATANDWVAPYDTGVIVQLLDGEGSYEGSAVGDGAVGLMVRPELVQNRLYQHRVDVAVREIGVKILPERLDAIAGETACFAAHVTNAVDPSYRWLAHDGVHTGETYCWTAPTTEELALYCESNLEFVHSVRVESTSTTGARKPSYNPPDRYAEADISVPCDSALHYTGDFSMNGYVHETDPEKCQSPIELHVWGTITLDIAEDGTSTLDVFRLGTEFGPTCFTYSHPGGWWSPQNLTVEVVAGAVSLSALYTDGAGQWSMTLSGPLEGPLTGTMQHDYHSGQAGTITTEITLNR